MNFQDVMQSDYSFVRKSWGDSSIEPLQYIDFLAGTLRKDIRQWPLTPFLGPNGAPITDRNQINKIFMEYVEASEKQAAALAPPPATPASVEITQEMAERILVLTTSRAQTEIDNLKASRTRSLRHIADLSENYRQALQDLRGYNLKIENLSKLGGDNTIIQQIKDVCKNGFFVFTGIEDNQLQFETARPIVLSYLVTGEVEPMICDLGRFRILVRCTDYVPRVKGLESNIHVFGHLHPHVDSGGSICWGEIRGLVKKASQAGDLVTLMGATRDLLCSYHDANPFTKINWFYYFQAIKQMDPFETRKYWTGSGKAGEAWRLTNEDHYYRLEDAMTRILRERPSRKVDLKELAPFLEDIFRRRVYPVWDKLSGTILPRSSVVSAVSTDNPTAPPTHNANGLSYSHEIEIPERDEEGDETGETVNIRVYGPSNPEDEIDEARYEDFSGVNAYTEDGEEY